MTAPQDPFGGEYGSPDLRLSGVWSLLSFLCALPGLLFPWLFPLLVAQRPTFLSFRTLLYAIPGAAVAGALAGLVGVWRARSLGRSGRVAGWAAILNLIVLACCVVAVVVTLRGLRR
jgi:hypothetical protein